MMNLKGLVVVVLVFTLVLVDQVKGQWVPVKKDQWVQTGVNNWVQTSEGQWVKAKPEQWVWIDSIAVSLFVDDILPELTNQYQYQTAISK